MFIIFDGTPHRPMGRQLYAEEWPRQDPPVLRSPSPRTMVKVGELSLRTKVEDDGRIRHLLRENPRTATELRAVTGWTSERMTQVIGRLLRRGDLCRLGHRYGEVVYDVTTTESRPL